MTIRTALLAGIAAATLMGAAAQAAVFTIAGSAINGDGAQDFSFDFGNSPVPTVFGQALLKLDFGFVVADGAQDGAALGITTIPGGLVSLSTGKSGVSKAVLENGAAQTYAGAGGTPGTVRILPFAAENTTGATKTFNFNSITEPVTGSDRALHLAVGGVVIDGETSDGGAIGLGSNATIATATLAPAGSVGAGSALAFSPNSDGFQSSNSVAGLDCGVATCNLTTALSFTVTPEDFVAMLTRTEVGRLPPPGDVLWTYRPAPISTTVDCGSEGCDFLAVKFEFKLSSRDAVAVIVRAEILPIGDVPVPVPASLALLTAGVGVLGAMRRRRAG